MVGLFGISEPSVQYHCQQCPLGHYLKKHLKHPTIGWKKRYVYIYAPKTNMDIQNSHIWKDIGLHFSKWSFLVSMLDLGSLYLVMNKRKTCLTCLTLQTYPFAYMDLYGSIPRIRWEAPKQPCHLYKSLGAFLIGHVIHAEGKNELIYPIPS